MGRMTEPRFSIVPIRFTVEELELIRDARGTLSVADYAREAALDRAAAGVIFERVSGAYSDVV